MTDTPEQEPVETAAEGGAEQAPPPGESFADRPVDDPREGVDEAATEPAEPAGSTAEQQLAERTLDLQRLQAEYVNYRKRVERDRAQSRTQGELAVLRSLLTVLDDIGRADQHGELTGGFKAVADSLTQALKAHKLEAFGAQGEPFDPRLHEALFNAGQAPGITDTSIAEVVRVGYKVGDEVLRHAQVGVIEPAPAEPAPEAGDGPTEGTAGESVDVEA